MVLLKKSLLLLSVFSACIFAGPASNASDEKLHAIAAALSAQRIESDIKSLVGFGTRHSLSETESESRGIGAARRWIQAQFESISKECGGCLEVFTVSGTIVGTNRIPAATEIVNVVALQRGTRDRDRVAMMTADIDSRVSDVMNFDADSPGANDNASGMAGVLETARVLSQYQFDGTIAYVGLSGEEQGLHGGKILADHALEQGWNIDAVLNNDMIGNITGVNGVTDNSTARVFSEGTRFVESDDEARQRRFQGGEVDSASRNLARYIDELADRYIDNLDVMMIYRLDRFGRGGHHRPFNEAGIPAVRIMETNENYTQQHQDIRSENGINFGDIIEHVDFSYAAKLSSLNAVTLASLAWSPAPPVNVEIRGQVSPDTTLSWQKVPGASFYRLHWRLTTSPVWTHFRNVGDVEEFTLENTVIDNYFFGVSSVSGNGISSPVVFPGAAGAY